MEAIRHSLQQFIKFAIVGLINNLIYYVVYIICIVLSMHYIGASAIGFLASVVNAYYWNGKYVFAKKDNKNNLGWQIFVKTFISYAGTGLVLNNLLLIFWIEFLNMNGMIAPVLNLMLTVPLNFLINKFWTFRRRQSR